MILRLKVPDNGSRVGMASRFGAEPAKAAALIDQAFDAGLYHTCSGIVFDRWVPEFRAFKQG